MANLQQSLNNATSAAVGAAYVYAKTPMGKRMAALQSIKQEEANINKQIEIEGRRLSTADDETEKQIQQNYTEQLSQLVSLGERRYKMNPTQASFESLLRRQGELEEQKVFMKDIYGGND